MNGPVRRIGLLVLALVGVLAVSGGVAHAHAGLDNSIPAASSVLAEGPEAIVLDFDEPVESSLASVRLFDDAAEQVELGSTVAVGGDGSVVSTPVPDLDDGTYAVVWRVTSLDGHVIDGAFSFQIGTEGGDGGGLIDRVSGTSGADPALVRLADLARLLGFVGMTLLLGAGLFAALAPAKLAQVRATRRLIVIGAILSVVAAVGAFGLHAAQAVGGTLADALSPDAWGKVAATRTGQVLLARAGLAALACALLATSSRRSRPWWPVAGVAVSVGLVATFPAAGHPAAASPAALWQVVDGVHFAAVIVWLGGLALFTLGGRAWLRDAEAEPVVRRFSSFATVAVPVIVVTGSLQAVELAGGLDALGESVTETDWGRRLLIKVSTVVVLVALGGVSRWLLRAAGVASLRRTVAAEAVIGLVVLGVTASMLALAPVASARSEVFSTAVTEAGVIADITVTPGRVGSNEVHVVLAPPGGSLTPISGATARVALPELDIPASPVELTAIGANHYTGVVTLPYPGDWRLDLVVEVTAGSTVLLRTTVPVP